MFGGTDKTSHALVLGGSIAGLLAAHTLSSWFDEVTIVERDSYPATGEQRKGVPQGRQIHALLAGGRRALDVLFPNFTQGILERGALEVDAGTAGKFFVADRLLPRQVTGLASLLVSRPLLEGYIRELVLARPNITARESCVAEELLGTSEAITGAQLRHSASETTEAAYADLVVDATGRGSRMPRWLANLGVEPAPEERVTVNIGYVTCTIRRKPQHLGGDEIFVINPHRTSRRAGAALAMEGERFIVTMLGYLDEPLPSDHAGMLAYARTLLEPDLYELLSDAEPLTAPAKMRFPASQRRHYEQLKRFPRGLLVCGDAFCSFNSAYGQGMSVAAQQALALQACLEQGKDRLFERFSRAASKLVDAPWSLVVGADLGFEGVQGKQPWSARLLNPYMERLMRAASHDRELSRALMHVMHLVTPPSTLLAPRVVWRVVRSEAGTSHQHTSGQPRRSQVNA